MSSGVRTRSRRAVAMAEEATADVPTDERAKAPALHSARTAAASGATRKRGRKEQQQQVQEEQPVQEQVLGSEGRRPMEQGVRKEEQREAALPGEGAHQEQKKQEEEGAERQAAAGHARGSARARQAKAAAKAAATSDAKRKAPGPTRAMEEQLRAQGHAAVGGADEAGRGPLAGPVVAAVVVLPCPRAHPGWCLPPGLDDSKAMDEAAREAVYTQLTSDPRVKWAASVIEHDEIDRINILQAALGAMRNAANAVIRHHSQGQGEGQGEAQQGQGQGGQQGSGPALDYLLVDGNRLPKDLPVPGRAVVKGDATVSCIAAASVIAKVTRDRLMVALDAQYPQYGFAQHKGYGVPAHMEAIARHGPCPQHRRSFEPVKSMTGWSRERMLAEEAAEREGKEDGKQEGKEAKGCGDGVEGREAKKAKGRAKAVRGAATKEQRQRQEGNKGEGLGEQDGEGQKGGAEGPGADGKEVIGAAKRRIGRAGDGRVLGAEELGTDLADGDEDQGAAPGAKRPRRQGKGRGTGRGHGQGGAGQEGEAVAEQQEAVMAVAVAEAESPDEGGGDGEGGPREASAGRKRGAVRAAKGAKAVEGEAAPPPKRPRRGAAAGGRAAARVKV